MMPLLDMNEERVARKFSDPRTMIGISDGGAHVDMLCNAGYPTYLIGNFRARQAGALTLEHAVKRITSEPARFLRDRAIAASCVPGLAADITIFDFDRIGSTERPEVRNDLPGGGRRLVTEAQGHRIHDRQRQSPVRTAEQHTGRCRGAFCVRANPRLRQGKRRESWQIFEGNLSRFAHDRAGRPMG